MLLTGILFAAEGDPPLEVPTLSQGRALFTRDLLHRRCEEALQSEQWSQLEALAGQAMEQEKEAFGEDFQGSDLTNFWLDAARIRQDKKPKFAYELDEAFSTLNEKASDIQAEALQQIPPESREAAASLFENRFNSKFQENARAKLLAVHQKSTEFVAGPYSRADAHFRQSGVARLS